MQRTIVVIDYDPAWAQTFRDISSVIESCLDELALRIEHVGSTSVPALAAKPIVEITVVIDNRHDLPAVVKRLSTLGYEHQGDGGIEGRESFRRVSRDIPRDGSGREWPMHYLYVCAQDCAELKRQILFRDYLRGHPDAVGRYAALKTDLADRFPHHIDSYVTGKTAFVEEILRLASTADP